MDEDTEDKIRDMGRLVDGEGHQLPQVVGGRRKHEVVDAVQFRTSEHLQVTSRGHVNAGAGDDHFLHPPFPHHLGQIVSDQAPVAGAHHVQRLHLQLIQKLPHRLRLKHLAPLPGNGGGASEEYEVRNVKVEVWGQGFDLSAPLPQCHGPKAVDENQRGLLGRFVSWAPKVHGGHVVKGEGLRPEARPRETASDVLVVHAGEVE